MIRPLRARHRWLVLLIAIVTALVFAVALAGRHGIEPVSPQVVESFR